MMLTKSNCPVCRTKGALYQAMPGYKLARCAKCGMVWDKHPSAALESLYGKNYFVNENPKGGYANYFEGMKINRKTFKERIARIGKRIPRKGRMLDVGCALGDSLQEAKQLGWRDLYGVELSDYAARKAKGRGLRVKIGTLRSAEFPSNFFDVVTIQDVIEHVKDPASELREVYRVLKPGGLVFVVTPDVGGTWAKILGQYWYHYKPGEHIMYFSQKSLRKILTDLKFKNVETRRTYHVMSIEYIINRMRYYSGLFGRILPAFRGNFVGELPLRVYAGEIEAWGHK